MLTFLQTTLGKYVAMVFGVILAVGVLFGLYKIWENQVANAALAAYNKAQLEQIAKDNAKYAEQLKQLNAIQQDILQQQKQDRDALNSKVDSITDYLNSPDAKKSDRESSDVLKETIKRLGQ